jgi:ATP-binding cassette, subfamily B, bacterial MsbA
LTLPGCCVIVPGLVGGDFRIDLQRKDLMNAFSRVNKYVWPQWPKVLLIFFSAFCISAMFSLSFVTIIPVLQVMMGQEGGLHGWVDSAVVKQEYGVEFHSPDLLALTANPEAARYLDVRKVKAKSAAEEAGLKERDRIVWVGQAAARNGKRQMTSEMLREMSRLNKGQSVPLIVERFEQDQKPGQVSLNLVCEKRPFYLAWAVAATEYVPVKDGIEDKMKAMTVIMVVLVIMTIIRCLGRFLQRYYGERVVQTAVAQIREEAFAKAMYMPVAYFESNNPSDSVSRMTRDSGEVGQGLKVLLGKTLVEPTKAIALFFTALCIDWKLTLIFAIGMPPAIIVMAQFGQKIKKATRKSLKNWSMILGKLEEVFSGVRVVKIYNRQEHESKSFNVINRKMLKQMFRVSRADAATEPAMEVLGVFAVVVIILLGTRWVVHEEMKATTFLAVLGFLGLAAESVRKSSDIYSKVLQSNVAAERMFAFMDQQVETEAPGAKVLAGVNRNIEFRDVWFSYPTSERPVLKGVSTVVKAGENVAVVGPNGSGKTTLLNLLPRFYDAQKGQVLIDGVDISGVTLASLRNQIGLVTQRVITFNDTVAANIAYGKANATMDEIVAAAKRSYADEFITQLPQGYETIIGEHGSGLSGGQLQRLVIARAIVKNPPILIFDEAMSQVDAESEAKINRALEEFMHGRTSFIIAHRFSTVKSADRIIVMNGGIIEAQGRHEELIDSCRLYRNLYETQLIR